MIRFFIGLLLGVILTAQALWFAGVGHGSYAPLICVASIIGFVPILGLVAGPLLWALYFLIIPNLDNSRSQVVLLSLILFLHLVPGFWIASQDPALAQTNLLGLTIFGLSFLATVALLLFFTRRTNRTRLIRPG